MQPVIKQIVKRSESYLPPLVVGYTNRDRVASYDNEVALGKHCLQETRLQKVSRGFFHADRLARIPMFFPALPQL